MGRSASATSPAGRYEIELEGSQLPAHYAEDDGRQTVIVRPRTSAQIALRAISLHAVHGREYLDRNRNQQFDRGEGAAAIVVLLGDLATLTDTEGRYTFHNVAPGAHLVRLDRSRLRTDIEPASADEVEVRLLPDGTGGRVDFTVRPRQKPVRMQEEM